MKGFPQNLINKFDDYLMFVTSKNGFHINGLIHKHRINFHVFKARCQKCTKASYGGIFLARLYKYINCWAFSPPIGLPLRATACCSVDKASHVPTSFHNALKDEVQFNLELVYLMEENSCYSIGIVRLYSTRRLWPTGDKVPSQ